MENITGLFVCSIPERFDLKEKLLFFLRMNGFKKLLASSDQNKTLLEQYKEAEKNECPICIIIVNDNLIKDCFNCTTDDLASQTTIDIVTQKQPPQLNGESLLLIKTILPYDQEKGRRWGERNSFLEVEKKNDPLGENILIHDSIVPAKYLVRHLSKRIQFTF